MSAPPALEARGLGMRFGGVDALAGLSLSIPAGEIHGLIGPNGAGKTTFFNCVSGFYRPTAGELYLHGQRIDGLPMHEAARLGISRTFQNSRLFANMTAVENVLAGSHHDRGWARTAAPGSSRGLAAARRAAALPRAAWSAVGEVAASLLRPPAVAAAEREALGRAWMLLAAVGLAGRENEIAGSLPYGDQRRLELARALATRPRVLLLDEPTAGMNPQESMAMVQLIRRIRDEFATTVVLIEHQMHVVMGVCEQITVLDYGRKISEGTPAEVQRDPAVIEAYLGPGAIGKAGHGAP